MNETADEHLEENSAKWKISLVATEDVKCYPNISTWNSGKREVNGSDVSCGSRISKLFLQAGCSAPLFLTATVDWSTLQWTICFWLPKNDPTAAMLVLKQLMTGSAWQAAGYYSLLFSCGWNVNLFTVSCGSSVQLCSAPQGEQLLERGICCLAHRTEQGHAGSVRLSLKARFFKKCFPAIAPER